MFRTSSLSIVLLAGLIGACGIPSGESCAQESGSPGILIESVKVPQDNPGAFINRYGLTRDDLRNIRKLNDGIKWVIPMRTTFVEARYGSETSDVFLCGTDENYSHKLNPDKLHGRFLLDKDVTRLNNVAVIGDRIAANLFGNRDPVGRNVRIGNDYYLIVGRLDSTAFQQDISPEAMARLSHSIVIPLSTMKARIGDDQIVRGEGSFSAESFELSSIEIVPETPNQALKVWNSIRPLLKANHPVQDYKLRVTQ